MEKQRAAENVPRLARRPDFNIFKVLKYNKLAALYTIYTIDFGVPKGCLHKFYCVKANYAN